jgi:hypothetical protein
MADATRKRALQTIFTELKADSFRERKAIMHQLDDPLRFLRNAQGLSPGCAKRVDKSMEGVQGSARQLREALEITWTARWEILALDIVDGRAGFADFVGKLRLIEQAIADRRKATRRRGRGRQPDFIRHMATQNLLGALEPLYTAATGKRAGGGRVNNANSPKDRKPSGPFIRLVKAALMLAGDSRVGGGRGDDAVLAAIDNYKDFRKREEAAKKRRIQEHRSK